MQVWGDNEFDVTKKCFQCKHRLKRITGQCYPISLATAVLISRDDMYGCNFFEPLKDSHENRKRS